MKTMKKVKPAIKKSVRIMESKMALVNKMHLKNIWMEKENTLKLILRLQ